MYVFLIIGIFYIAVAVIKSFGNDGKNTDSPKDEERNDIIRETEKSNNMEGSGFQIANDSVQVEIGTRDLLMHMLTQIGCQYTVDEEDQRIYFAYQGEDLWAEASNNCMFINVWDTFWESRELHDVEGVTNLKQAINTVNLNETVMVSYTINEADNTMWVHSKTNFLFIPQIPELDTYLRSMFAALFQAHHVLGAEMERMKREKK